ncbi:methyl-accepting chemotaxis protein, partial [Paraburkholderia sp. Se-20369]|nr:methyl-accepting chemotaxis protein [Paraburkholderia sp. Se-20369]
MKAATLRPQPDAPVAMPDHGAKRAARTARAARRPWSVKATLRAAFAVLLVGTLAIGVFSLAQISRLNGSIASVYEQGHVASRAAQDVRAEV